MFVRSSLRNTTLLLGCIVTLTTGCGGNRASLPLLPPNGPSIGSSVGSAAVKIQLSVAADVVRAARFTPQYVSPSMKSITIAENGTPLGTFNATPKSGGCTSANGGTICVFTVKASTGKDQTFAIATYDKQNGAGKMLSSAKIVQTISSGTTVIPVTLKGVVAKVTIALQNPTTPAGTAAKLDVIVMAKDPDGNTIVGPGNYNTPISLTDSDKSGATKLSAKTIAGPSDRVTLDYNGKSLTRATIAASAKGAKSGVPAVFAPAPTVLRSFELPKAIGSHTGLSLESFAITLGPDGNLWLDGDDNFAYGAILRMTPKGTFTTFVPGKSPSTNLPNDAFTGLVTGSDGNVWYLGRPAGGTVGGDVGKITTSGAATNHPVSGIGGACSGIQVSKNNNNRIIPAAGGGLWFTVQCTTGSQLVHATTSGTFKANTLASNFQAAGLVLAKNAKIYIAGYDSNTSHPAILQVTVSGANVTGKSMVDVTGSGGYPMYGIAQSADGDLWGTINAFGTPKALVRLHLSAGFTASSVSTFQTLAFGEEPAFLTALTDGSLWIPESNVQKVTQLLPNNEHAPAQFDLSVPGPSTVYPCMWDVALGTDRNLYFNNSCRNNGVPLRSGNVVKLAY